jgi:hypothetical protein
MAEEFGNPHDMGNIVRRFTGKGVVGPTIGFIIGLGLTILGIWALMQPNVDDYGYLRAALLVGGVVLLVSGIELSYALGNHLVVLFDDGFIYSNTRKLVAAHWSDIQAVWQLHRKGRGATIRYTVKIRGIEKLLVLTVDHFKEVDDLGQTIQNKVSQVLLPKYIAALREGKRVKFGNFAIDNQGISSGNKLVPWEKIQQVSIRNGVVMIKQEGQWIAWPRVMVADIPNLFVFLTLVDQVVKIN